jgi:hypothetical protein
MSVRIVSIAILTMVLWLLLICCDGGTRAGWLVGNPLDGACVSSSTSQSYWCQPNALKL